MGGKSSKEVNHFDQLQDSRDAMKLRDQHHLEKIGSTQKLEFVPRIEHNHNNADARKSDVIPPRPPVIVCCESAEG